MFFLSFLPHNSGFLAPIITIVASEMGMPIPFPEDLLIVFVGIQVAKHTISFFFVYLLILLIVLAGQSFLYILAYFFGQRIVLFAAKFLHLNQQKLLHVEAQFRRYGFWFIIFGRHIPGLRDPIAIFSGIAKVNYKIFVASEFFSTVLTIPLYLWLGEKFGVHAIRLLRSSSLYIVYIVVPLIVVFLGYFYLKRIKRK